MPPALESDLPRICDFLWAQSAGTGAENQVCIVPLRFRDRFPGPCNSLRSGSASGCRWIGRVDSRAESQRCSRLRRCQGCRNMPENRGRRPSCRVSTSSALEVDMLSGMSDVSSSPAAAARTCRCARVWRRIRTSGFCGELSLCSEPGCTVSVCAGRSF